MRVCAIAAALGTLAAALSLPVEAMPIQPTAAAESDDASAYMTLVAQGCGYGRWRGPWGHCRSTPYYGPLPGGGYKPYYGGGGCPPGWWRGPWGHCRNTPYHGRLPDGGYQ